MWLLDDLELLQKMNWNPTQLYGIGLDEETAREVFAEANTGKIIEYCYPMPSNITYSTVKQITPDVFEVR